MTIIVENLERAIEELKRQSFEVTGTDCSRRIARDVSEAQVLVDSATTGGHNKSNGIIPLAELKKKIASR